MIEIKEAFKKDGKAFVTFLTAGDPTLQDTARYLQVLQDNGADLIEIGIPFSDPVAEGPVIQAADIRALKNNVCIDDIFEMLQGVERKVPFLFMTYANPVFFYGYEKFFSRCRETGIAGIILPDIPYEESEEVKSVARKYGVVVIDMVAPTSKERIQTVCKDAQGFIYLVSSLGVTGVRKEITTDIGAIARDVKAVTSTPVCVGFGISTPEQAGKTAAESDGAIVGSAIVRIIAEHGSNADEALAKYISDMSKAVHSAR
ncbi:MAG: tryptophan synthase subunit alpha [Clostridia bacterium]|nr:tryptophan synthase subunit alpha [Clostridia bacterium]